MSINYTVNVELFAERHYIKSFKKKYKTAWDVTWRALEREFQSFDKLFDTDIVDKIIDVEDIKICKVDFKVAGTPYSKKASGNRCIVVVDNIKKLVRVLLVYGKTDLPSGNETAAWKKIVRENYPEFKDICY